MKKSLKTRVTVAAALMASLVTPAVFAAGEAAAAMDGLLTEAEALISKGWLIAIPVTVGFIGIKLFRKAANKST